MIPDGRTTLQWKLWKGCGHRMARIAARSPLKIPTLLLVNVSDRIVTPSDRRFDA